MTTISVRRGRRPLSPVDRGERIDYILGRLKSGFSFLEVQKGFCERFGYKAESGRKWINQVCKTMTFGNDPRQRQRMFHQIIELYHSQITAYQNELLAVQRQIDQAMAVNKQRKELLLMFPKAPQNELEEMRAALATLPETSPVAMVSMLEAKSRVRERLCRIVSDLARLQCIGSDGDWKNALNILLDNNLIPPQLAERILGLLDEFDCKLHSVGQNLQSHQ